MFTDRVEGSQAQHAPVQPKATELRRRFSVIKGILQSVERGAGIEILCSSASFRNGSWYYILSIAPCGLIGFAAGFRLAGALGPSGFEAILGMGGLTLGVTLCFIAGYLKATNYYQSKKEGLPLRDIHSSQARLPIAVVFGVSSLLVSLGGGTGITCLALAIPGLPFFAALAAGLIATVYLITKSIQTTCAFLK